MTTKKQKPHRSTDALIAARAFLLWNNRQAMLNAKNFPLSHPEAARREANFALWSLDLSIFTNCTATDRKLIYRESAQRYLERAKASIAAAKARVQQILLAHCEQKEAA